MRVFFALIMPEPIKQKMMDFIAQLKTQYTHEKIKWATPEKLHLTLRFLGEITETQYKALIPLAKLAMEGFDPFDCAFESVELFPHRRPKTISLIMPQVMPLTRIFYALGIVMDGVGVPVENRLFKPHLTVARFNANHPITFDKRAVENFKEISVKDIALIKSVTKREGSEYTLLERFPLKKS